MTIFVQHLFDSLGPYPGPPNAIFGTGGGLLFYRYGAIIGIVAGILSIWRPAFLVPLFYFYLAWREVISVFSGIFVTETDYLGMLDVGYFSVLGVLATIVLTSPWALERVALLRRWMTSPDGIDALRHRAYGL